MSQSDLGTSAQFTRYVMYGVTLNLKRLTHCNTDSWFSTLYFSLQLFGDGCVHEVITCVT